MHCGVPLPDFLSDWQIMILSQSGDKVDFCPDWNISTTTRWIHIVDSKFFNLKQLEGQSFRWSKSVCDIYGSKMNCNCTDPLDHHETMKSLEG